MNAATILLDDNIIFGNNRPFVLIGGMNVIESRDSLFEVAGRFVEIARDQGIPFVFKASFDKANRTSIHSYRGPGLEKGLELLAEVKARFDVPILTDVHESWQAAPTAEVADIIQLPAFLARQSDLVAAMARTDAVINVKKPQFLAPAEMRHILEKFHDAGNGRVLLCERGTSFGYNNLIVDMLGVDEMKALAPVVFDVTHSLQRPGARAASADGRAEQAIPLARAGLAVGIAGLFIEAHPDPSNALCDGPSALPLEALDDLVRQAKAVDAAVKNLAAVPVEA